jgi:hypothetical protein
VSWSALGVSIQYPGMRRIPATNHNEAGLAPRIKPHDHFGDSHIGNVFSLEQLADIRWGLYRLEPIEQS